MADKTVIVGDIEVLSRAVEDDLPPSNESS